MASDISESFNQFIGKHTELEEIESHLLLSDISHRDALEVATNTRYPHQNLTNKVRNFRLTLPKKFYETDLRVINLIKKCANDSEDKQISQDTDALLDNLETLSSAIDKVDSTTPLAKIKCLKTQLEHFTNNFYKVQTKNKNLNSMTLTFTDKDGEDFR